MVKAWIYRQGDLVLVETESGQKAVVPSSSLCNLIVRFRLEIVNEEIRCERYRSGVQVEVEDVVDDIEEESY